MKNDGREISDRGRKEGVEVKNDGREISDRGSKLKRKDEGEEMKKSRWRKYIR